MALTNDQLAHTLNHLITTCRDGEDGFKSASEGVESSELKSLFTSYSSQRAQLASELQNEVTRLGVKPEDDGSTMAAMHRGWINLKSAITGHDDHAILAECERGEDSAVDAYQEALEQELPADVREVVRRQFMAVKASHDRVRDLRDSASAKNSASSHAHTA